MMDDIEAEEHPSGAEKRGDLRKPEDDAEEKPGAKDVCGPDRRRQQALKNPGALLFEQRGCRAAHGHEEKHDRVASHQARRHRVLQLLAGHLLGLDLHHPRENVRGGLLLRGGRGGGV